MEVFSKGIHRALVPLDSQMENISGVELVESSSSYRMLTQMDVLKFIKAHGHQELRDLMVSTVRSAGAVTDTVLAVTHRTRAIDAIKCLRNASLQAVPIVEASDIPPEGNNQLINVSEDCRYILKISRGDLYFRLFHVVDKRFFKSVW